MARIHGTLVKWNEARGFGFLLPAQGSAEVFVHVSAFPRTGPPPRVGEVVSFEIEPGPDGRQRAVRLWRAGVTPVPIAPRVDGPVAPRMLPGGRRPTASRVLSRIAFAAGVGALALLAANLLRDADSVDWALRPRSDTQRALKARAAPAAAIAADSTFVCDGRTRCGQMHSCAEATYFLRHCPNVQMDGDHDGIPCEQQWCTQ